MAQHVPRKRFGQHFLNDISVIDRIVATIAPLPNEQLVEIGPGQGAITLPLLKAQASLLVVELDRELLQDLFQYQNQYPRLKILNQDALTLELASLTHEKIRIVGNLPYNISSPLLFHLFDQRSLVASMIFMLQKEVVDRLCANRGDSEYSRLSVMAQFYCDLERHFDIEPAAFSPSPKVMSSIISLTPRPQDPDIDTRVFAELVRQAFSHRRKMLRNNLSSWFSEDEYARLGIDPKQRAQELSVDQFKAMTRQVMLRPGGKIA